MNLGAFDLLSKNVLEILKELGIESETQAQQEAIPFIMEGDNTLIIAPTGVGKTEAALLPLLEKINRDDSPGFKLLYITPLRALNRDMVRRIEFFARRLNFTVSVRHGDTTKKERLKQSRNPPDVLITTPETLQIMFTGHKLRSGLMNVEYIVVDELNELAVDERGSQLSLALERLVELKGEEFQRIGLSATVGSPENVLKFLVGMGREGRIVEIEGQGDTEIRIMHPLPKKGDKKLAEFMRCELDKAATLRVCRELIDSHRSTLIFVNTRDAAESLTSCFHLWLSDYPIGVHHGSLSKEARMDVEERFKEGELKAIICTSSMELGLDLGETDLVIQYQSPRQVTRLVQRVGRSGHSIGLTSKGVVLTTLEDDIAESTVIAERTLKRELESTEIPEKPMSVLSNQLISAVHSERRVDMPSFYKMAKRAYPFRDLSWNEYGDMVEQLAEIRVIWKEEETLGKRRSSLRYFYDNISMIPDEKTFLLKDISKNAIVGTLDESFVASNIELGGVVTLQGKAWKVIDIEEESVIAQPVADLGRIPDWSGEDIPVPFEVSQNVGGLREKGVEDYEFVDKDAKKQFQEYLDSQKDLPRATATQIVIEMQADTAVVNGCFGSKVNETFGRLIAALLSARLGESVAVHTDPYRIMIKLPRRAPPSMIEEILTETDPLHLEGLLRKAIKRSSFFRWRFLHVAKKFGAVRKDVDYRSLSLDPLMETFENTPMYQEALDKVFRDNLDIVSTEKVMQRIQGGEIEVITSLSGLSPMGEAGLEKHMELMDTSRVSRAVLDSFRERLESETLYLKCMKCRSGRRRMVKDIRKPRCMVCGSSMVAPLSRYHDSSILKKPTDKMSSQEKKTLREFYKLANLARVYKHRAALALAARGVGHGKAARILAKQHRDDFEFLKALLRAEIQYARTKRFWD
ncbi:MAG: DEAD/DEAH box helicase [Thermoplasmata archaeon]